ncbi:MAG: cytochrome c oxidase subunit 3, partial [Zoogloea sp.]|nr:cytochrome c oxidase subunit 3 [Zoogloea sp.]
AMAAGAAMWVNEVGAGRWTLAAGVLALAAVLAGWFGRVIAESERGKLGHRVDLSFRWGMGWFIFSEVMFFAVLFGTLFYMRVVSVPDLARGDNLSLLWQGFSGGWPSAGPGATDRFAAMAAWGIPAINTLILLSSGGTLTWAHAGLLRQRRWQLVSGLAVTIVLGLTFLGLQVHEYGHAYSELNLRLSSGVYGATFFILTGFHGLHVTLGVIILSAVLGRALAGHFRPDHHFAFEAAAWYWHFVDAVWLMLFVTVYWL